MPARTPRRHPVHARAPCAKQASLARATADATLSYSSRLRKALRSVLIIHPVGHALAIFDAFDNEHLSLSLQEIAERIRMPKTTAFRLVNTLERAGFLIRMDNQQYCLSLKLARLGGLVRGTLSIREIARPVMFKVGEQTSETITLNTIVGNERMVLEVVDTSSPLMSMARLGQHMPLLLGASSRILMAYMAREQLEAVLKANTAGIDFDRAAFDCELARFRRQGYALSRGQRVPGLTAISGRSSTSKGACRIAFRSPARAFASTRTTTISPKS